MASSLIMERCDYASRPRCDYAAPRSHSGLWPCRVLRGARVAEARVAETLRSVCIRMCTGEAPCGARGGYPDGHIGARGGALCHGYGEVEAVLVEVVVQGVAVDDLDLPAGPVSPPECR